MEKPVRFHAQKGGTEIIPSRLLIPSQLVKYIYKEREKAVASRFYPVPGLRQTAPWRGALFYFLFYFLNKAKISLKDLYMF